MPTVEAVRELAVSGPGWGPVAAGSGGVKGERGLNGEEATGGCGDACALEVRGGNRKEAPGPVSSEDRAGEKVDFYKVLFSGRRGGGDAVQMQSGVWSTEAWGTGLL